jgi:hypothetical protein
VQVWEDYNFIASSERVFEEPSSEQQSARLMDQLAECPLLLRIFHAFLWAEGSYMTLSTLRYLLNISWHELRAALCRLRPSFPDDLPYLYELSQFIHNSMTHPASWKANISLDLAFGCIRVLKLIETGDLPECLW